MCAFYAVILCSSIYEDTGSLYAIKLSNIHATSDFSPMLSSNASLGNSPSPMRNSKPNAHHSNSPALHKKRSSDLLFTSSLNGVSSEQDRATSISSSMQLSYTKSCSKASNNVLSNSTYNDSIGVDHGISAKHIKAAATASQALSSNAGITSIPVEETETGHKQSYTVLIGNSVRPVNAKLYASLPLRNKFMVKQQEQNVYGSTIVRLVLKSSHERLVLSVNMCLYDTELLIVSGFI